MHHSTAASLPDPPTGLQRGWRRVSTAPNHDASRAAQKLERVVIPQISRSSCEPKPKPKPKASSAPMI